MGNIDSRRRRKEQKERQQVKRQQQLAECRESCEGLAPEVGLLCGAPGE